MTTSHPFNMSTDLNSDHDTTLFDGLLIHALLQSLHQRSGWSHASIARKIMSMYQEACPLDRIGQEFGEEGCLIAGLFRRISARDGITESAIANNLAKGFDQVTYFVFPPERHDLVLIALQLARKFLYQLNDRSPAAVEGNSVHVSSQGQSSDAVHISNFPSSEDNGVTDGEPPTNTSGRGPSKSTQDDDSDHDGTSNYSTNEENTHELEKSLWKFSTFLNLSKNLFSVSKQTQPPSNSYSTEKIARNPFKRSSSHLSPSPFPDLKIQKTHRSIEVELEKVQSPTQEFPLTPNSKPHSPIHQTQYTSPQQPPGQHPAPPSPRTYSDQTETYSDS